VVVVAAVETATTAVSPVTCLATAPRVAVACRRHCVRTNAAPCTAAQCELIARAGWTSVSSNYLLRVLRVSEWYPLRWTRKLPRIITLMRLVLCFNCFQRERRWWQNIADIFSSCWQNFRSQNSHFGNIRFRMMQFFLEFSVTVWLQFFDFWPRHSLWHRVSIFWGGLGVFYGADFTLLNYLYVIKRWLNFLAR